MFLNGRSWVLLLKGGFGGWRGKIVAYKYYTKIHKLNKKLHKPPNKSPPSMNSHPRHLDFRPTICNSLSLAFLYQLHRLESNPVVQTPPYLCQPMHMRAALKHLRVRHFPNIPLKILTKRLKAVLSSHVARDHVATINFPGFPDN